MKMKQCSVKAGCGVLKDASEFNKDSKSKDGLKYLCKSCRYISEKKYRERTSPEERAAKKHKFYMENSEAILTTNREWTKANIERKRQINREYVKNNTGNALASSGNSASYQGVNIQSV